MDRIRNFTQDFIRTRSQLGSIFSLRLGGSRDHSGIAFDRA